MTCNFVRLWYWAAALCVAGLLLGSAARATPVEFVARGGQDLTPALEVVEDPSAMWTLAQAQQQFAQGQGRVQPQQREALGLGFSRSAFWVRLVLDNPTAKTQDQMLRVANARISYITLYMPQSVGVYHAVVTGGDMPFATRQHDNREFLFPLQLAPYSQTTYYLRVQSTIGLLLPVELWAADDFEHQERQDYMRQAWYLGIATAMVIFNLLLFIALRHRIYLTYVGFVLLVVGTVGIKTGMVSEFLAPQTLVWTGASYFTGASWTLLCFIHLMRRVLGTRKHLPRVDRGLQLAMVLQVLLPLLYWWDMQRAVPLAIASFVLTGAALLVVSVWCVRRRMRAAYFFVAAFAMLLVGGVVTPLRALGVLPTNVVTVDGLQLGSALEMLLLAFALADRYNVLRQERLKAQRDLVDAQRELLELSQAAERTLEQRVEERTLQLQQLNERLEALSLQDALTGVANRRQFDHMLRKEWSRMERQGEPLALLMLDVDSFKPYNDQYGHPAGDECLRAVALAIAGASRGSDLVARYGGEEFVVIAPATAGADALQLAQRACQAVHAFGLVHGCSDQGVVTLSCGVASAIPGPDSSLEALLRRADDALYTAKARGRNQVVLAADER